MDFEKALLTYCLKTTKAIDLTILKRLTKDQFSTFDNQKIFDILMWVYKKYKCLLTETILKQLLDKSSIKSPEDQKRVALLFFELSQAPTPELPPEFIVDQFIEKYVKEQLEVTLRSTAGLLRDKETNKALVSLRNSAVRLTTLASEEKLEEGYIGDDVATRLQNYQDKKANPTKFGGLSTGYPRFDTETNGLQKGQVCVVIGAPKSAKSIVLINIAHHAVSEGKRVLFIVNEGGRDLVLRRYTSLDAGVNYSNLRDGKLSELEEQKFKRSLEAVNKSKLLYVCSIPPVLCTTSLISSKMEDLEVDGKFDLVIIDYLGLMDSDSPSVKKEDDWKKLGSITLELKSMAMIKQVPILTVHHVNREGHKKKGTSYAMTDISRSYEVTKHVDLLISWKVVNPEEFDLLHSGDITMKITASRDSAPSLIELFADLSHMEIKEKPSGFSVDHPELNSVQEPS